MISKGQKYLSSSDGRTRKVARLFRHKNHGEMVEMECQDCQTIKSTEMTVKEVERLLKFNLWSLI